jgi:hypothetical protein
VFPQNHIPPFERTVQDATKVQRLYNTLLALPTAPRPGSIYCPIDLGIYYALTFGRRGITVLYAAVEEGGCRYVSLSTGGLRRAYSDTFWKVLADTVSVPESELFPSP